MNLVQHRRQWIINHVTTTKGIALREDAKYELGSLLQDWERAESTLERLRAIAGRATLHEFHGAELACPACQAVEELLSEIHKVTERS